MSENYDPLIRDHSRDFHDQKYVYPVISRRSKGLSIGINLSLDCLCNFNCAYCQVDIQCRKERLAMTNPPGTSLELLAEELRRTIKITLDGTLFLDPWFAQAPQNKRRFNDIAFSGDGEPTLSPAFPKAMKLVTEIHQELCPETVKIVLITNATMLHTSKVAEAVEVMMQNHGEIWAKLDAGSEELYKWIDRSNVPFSTILNNLEMTAKRHPIVIQSIFLAINGAPPTQKQINAYIDRLNGFLEAGCQIKHVQAYTIARSTTESWVSPLSSVQLHEIARQIEEKTALMVEIF